MTETTQRGMPIPLLSEWFDYIGGPHAAVTNLTITITPVTGGSPVVGPTSTGISNLATGIYVYTWTPAGDAALGDYVIVWSATEGDASDLVEVTSAAVGDDQTADVWYCTREDVMRAQDWKETARTAAQIDRAIAGATGEIEGLTHRRFYPMLATKSWDWPREQGGRSWRLWLDGNELIEAAAVVSGGVTLTDGDYYLEPRNSGPPFTNVQVNRDGNAVWGGGSNIQRAIEITGLWGYTARGATAGTLAETLDDTETAVDVSNSAAIGVGQILRVGAERMIVTAKSQLDTGQNLGANLGAMNNEVTVAVGSGAAFAVDEVILIDSERMLIIDIAANTLTVKRAWDGSVLAAHISGADIYAPRTLTVQRGALGTTAASHATSATVYKHLVPAQVRNYAVALAVVTVLSDQGGWARTVGSGENEREAAGRALVKARDALARSYARKARHRAV
ncbi:hypothetical protein Cme02nite_38200 [Catellatospora methionotrophica]|uniref:Uncharacterized protein n=1 Tax=Catellatospora methionotrophica TaxID=121620 RepID=A0A8J3L6U1_9ACTN|nr:hypothetical protein [Catellatospora methionotrophica]GIG15488.1 hypothetical protein Cme02nite_38200 [Catellatospora methionotrophica]